MQLRSRSDGSILNLDRLPLFLLPFQLMLPPATPPDMLQLATVGAFHPQPPQSVHQECLPRLPPSLEIVLHSPSLLCLLAHTPAWLLLLLRSAAMDLMILLAYVSQLSYQLCIRLYLPASLMIVHQPWLVQLMLECPMVCILLPWREDIANEIFRMCMSLRNCDCDSNSKSLSILRYKRRAYSMKPTMSNRGGFPWSIRRMIAPIVWFENGRVV